MKNKKNTPVNPLKFFNDALEFRRMAIGGSIMNMGSTVMGADSESSMDSDNPNKRRKKQAKQQRWLKRHKTRGCSRKPMFGSAGEECIDDMA
jgi:hypothetical protein